MKVEEVRFVSDRYEWVSIACRAPSVYHRWEWAEQSRRRAAHLLPHLDVDVSYLRVWSGDTLVSCPMLMIDDVWFNVPRAVPLVVEGGPIDPIRVIMDAASEDFEIDLIDDSKQLDNIDAVEWELNADADDTRSRQALAPPDVAIMRHRLTFPTEFDADTWFDALKWVERSGLADVWFVEFRRNDEPIGWHTHTTHLGETVVLAAAHVEHIVEPWTSQR